MAKNVTKNALLSVYDKTGIEDFAKGLHKLGWRIKRARDAGHDVRRAVAYSDSFFPFPDGPLTLAEAGVAVIFASRGSVKDAEVAKALTDAGVSFYTMPDASTRGFYAH